MTGINPSIDRVSENKSVNTDAVGAPTVADKYENTRHLKYGQTENQKNANVPESKGHEKKEESLLNPEPNRSYASCSDSAPTLHHSFHETFLSGATGVTGDDMIAHEEKKEKERKKREQEKKKTM
ncbi:12952_t:CDS:2 [Dentiscutata erythropus]|uniref:12952_t:CDS:1 n=1 Tax=Dentiscutata erythropus TaxID=1348616 RepID=A0A9N9IUW4_9GLOM|nr:12952_t:CDS:2 [Dentiscutata erythropus]